MEATGQLPLLIEPANEGSELLSAYARNNESRPLKAAITEAISVHAPELAVRLFAKPEIATLVLRSPTVRHKPLLELEVRSIQFFQRPTNRGFCLRQTVEVVQDKSILQAEFLNGLDDPRHHFQIAAERIGEFYAAGWRCLD